MCLGSAWPLDLIAMVCAENGKVLSLMDDSDEEAAAAAIHEHGRECACRPIFKSPAQAFDAVEAQR